MTNEIVPYTQRKDCEEILDEVAMPLLDLRDTSLQALDEGNSTVGDLQSQLLLAYSGSESPSRVFSRSLLQSNPLGFNKLVQAFLPIPCLIGAIASVELPAFVVTYHMGGVAYLLLMIAYFLMTSATILALLSFTVLNLRRGTGAFSRGDFSWLANLLEPDHIAISPQGLNLQWSGKMFSYMGLVLPWKRIALVYLEEHGSGDERYQILCIRDNLGKALRLDCREFASGVLIKALQKRAPWAVKAPPMVLALQPVQQYRWSYLVSWAVDIKRSLSSKRIHSPIETLVGRSLKKGKYKITVTSPIRKFGIEHIAEVSRGGGGNSSQAVSYKGLNTVGEVENSSSSRVRIRQFILPVKQNPAQWYWMLHHFEREVRRLSCVNNNNITRWLDVFVEGGAAYVVTEYDASKTLREIVQISGPLKEGRVREIALEMCEILLHLHHLDPPYIHKAFTPDSLILAKGEFVKLNQFAIGMQLVPSQFNCAGFDRRYTPLELLRGHESAQSDIYAFGGTLFYLLTGQDPKPFERSNAKSLCPELSERFNEIICKATEPNAQLRHESVQSIKEAILELANSETSLVLL
jgi:hypothetical protein